MSASSRDRSPADLDATGASSWRSDSSNEDTVRADEANSSPRAQSAGMWLGDRYRVLRLLGSGGMGEVYLVHDLTLGKDVAFKLVHDVRGGADGLRRLREEVLLAQRVTHRNVCRTYDLEEVG